MLLCVACVAASGAHAQVYKCVDASGRTTYGQTPCPANSRSEAVSHSVPPAPSAPAGAAKADMPAASKSVAEQEQDFRKRLKEREEADKKEQAKLADARVREQNCSTARQQMSMLESGMRQLRFGENGEQHYLDEAQIESEKATAGKAIEQWCK